MNITQKLITGALLFCALVMITKAAPSELITIGTPTQAFENGGVEGSRDGMFYFASGQGASRFQQVYSSDYFSKSLPQGGRLKYVEFRSDLFNRRSGGGNDKGFQISFSTTQAFPDHLENLFEKNVGSDSVTVLRKDQPFYFDVPGITNPDITIGLNVFVLFPNGEFFYDPRKGNLLLDIISENTPPSYHAFLDAYADASDGVSSLFAHSIDGVPLKGDSSTLGFVTTFHFEPIPEPSMVGIAAIALTGLSAFHRNSGDSVHKRRLKPKA